MTAKRRRLDADPQPEVAHGPSSIYSAVAGSSSQLLMSIDALAAAIAGLTPEDETALKSIQTTLEQFAANELFSPTMQAKARAAADYVSQARQYPLAERQPYLDQLDHTFQDLQTLLLTLNHPPSTISQPENISTDKTAEAGDSHGQLDDNHPTLADQSDSAAESNLFLMDPDILSQFMLESLERFQMVEADLLKLESNPGDPETLHAIFRAFHSTKGTASFLGLQDIKNLAHQAETLLEYARQGEIQLQGDLVDLALEANDTLRNMIMALESLAHGAKNPPPLPEHYPALLKRMVQFKPAPVAERIQDDNALRLDQQKDGQVPSQSSAAAAAGMESTISVSKKSKLESTEGSIRVNLQRMDHLINMVGELVIVHAMIAQDSIVVKEAGRHLGHKLAQLGKICRDLQDLSMSLRMIPLKATFQKMERAARDLARKSGKTIRFITAGEETEIDRNLVEGLNDPLVHLIRNAVDHGIESQAERQARGKPAEGNIMLRAYHAAGNVVLEVEDDGHGLDEEKIRCRARELGLLDPAKDLTQNDIYKLIFHPGFSTAQKITEVSGRGVGMDVVKKNIEAMRGRVEVNSSPGQAAIFTLRIPLTLAIIDGLVMNVGSQQYVVPTLHVKHILRPDPSTLSTVQGKGEMLKLRNHFIPIYRLYRLFQVQGAIEDPAQGMLLVVENEGRECALLIDLLQGQQQVVIKTLGEGLGPLTGVAGAAILGDGRVRLILDVAGVMQLAYQEDQALWRREEGSSPPTTRLLSTPASILP